ncbi:MAG: response regulator [Myxococcaceae bacterium]
MELAKQHKPAVILLDIIQNTDGRDLLAQLKGDPETKDIKVIICSALPDQYMRQLCFELGAVDYEEKPFDPLLMRRVARLAGVDNDQPAAGPTLSVV